MHRNHLEIFRKILLFFTTFSPFDWLAIFFLTCQIFQSFSLHRSMVRYNIVVLYPSAQESSLVNSNQIKYADKLDFPQFSSSEDSNISTIHDLSTVLHARSIDPCNESTSHSYFFFPPIVLAAIWGEDRLICGNVLRSKDFCSRQLAYQLRNFIENYRWRRHGAARLDVFEIRRPVISSTLES